MLVQLSASSVSTAVWDAWRAAGDWSVLGVYEESLNLSAGDEVISIVASETGNLPRGILVDLSPGQSWKALDLRPGAPVTVDAEGLDLAGRAKVRLAGAALWQARRRLESRCAARDMVGRVVRQAAGALEGSGGLGALGSSFEELTSGRLRLSGPDQPLLARAFPAVRMVLEGTVRGTPDEVKSGARGLVGLGIGLTPSGDDLLTGFIGSLVLLSERRTGLDWVSGTAQAVATEAVGRTTAVGLTYLRCAAAGEISELQERLLGAVVRGEAEEAVRACLRLRAFGHSSGGEIALGVLLAVEATCVRGASSHYLEGL